MLVDPRTGPVRRLRDVVVPDDLPQSLHLVEAVLADTTRWSPWPSDPTGAGCALWDQAAARGAALGEAAERYCGNLVRPSTVRASHDELVSAGTAAVDPDALSLFSEAQLDTPGFPFVRFGRDLPVRWERGWSLHTGSRTYVPSSLVWVTWFRAPPGEFEPRTNPVCYAGVAAGQDHEQALSAALSELLERDAVHVTWTAGRALEVVSVPDWLASVARGPTGAFDTCFLVFPSLVGSPVIGALTVHRPTGYVAMGTACRPTPVAAATKALAEALQLHLVVRQLDDPESPLGRLAATAASPLKPWCPDRRYATGYRADLRDATDLGCHLQLWLDPAERASLDDALEDRGRRLIDILSFAPGSDAIVRALVDHGIDPIGVDLTTDDVRRCGLVVLRVVAPGLYGNAPAAFSYLGGRRLGDAMDPNLDRRRLRPLPYG